MTKHRLSHAAALAGSLSCLVVVIGLGLPAAALAQISRNPPAPRLGLGAAPTAPPAAELQRQADYIVVVVNSEPITNSEVRTKLARTEAQMQQQGLPLPPRNQLAAQVLERMISDKAQLQAAQAAGLKVDDSAIEGAVQTVAQQNQVSPDELRRRLKADGIDYAQFRSDIRDELLISRLRQREVESRITVTEREIDDYLRNERSSKAGPGSTVPAALNLAEILIAVPENASAEQTAALQAKAQQVVERARAGADFSALAAEVSASPTRGNGGQMGLRAADRYPPLFIEATEKSRAGDIAGPVRSGAGFHILKVIEKMQGGLLDAVITQTHARHILLRLSPQLTEAAAVERLASMKRRIVSGQADFAALARESSQDTSARDGGDLGWIASGALVPEFEKVMNSLAPNQISDPLVSRFGVHLVQVLERRDVPISPRDNREMVRGLLREKKQGEAYSRWADDIRGRAYVEFREVAR